MPPVNTLDPSSFDFGRITKYDELSFVATVSPYTSSKSSDSQFKVVKGSEDVQSACKVNFDDGLNSDPKALLVATVRSCTTGGFSVGAAVGLNGPTVGRGVVGTGDGSGDGAIDGIEVGDSVGTNVGSGVGKADGARDGNEVGDNVGIEDGSNVGSNDGSEVGSREGNEVGSSVGCVVGTKDGKPVGSRDGKLVGSRVG